MARRKLTPFDLVAAPPSSKKKRPKPKTWKQVKTQARSNATTRRHEAGRTQRSEKRRGKTRAEYGINRRGYGAGRNPLADLITGKARSTTASERNLPAKDHLGRTLKGSDGKTLRPYGLTTKNEDVSEAVDRAKRDFRAKERESNRKRELMSTTQGRKTLLREGVRRGQGAGWQSLDKTVAGVAKGYYKRPLKTLGKDAEAVGQIAKSLASGAFISAAAYPRKTAKAVGEDYSRRYNKGKSEGASKNAEKIVKEEGGLSYVLDATVGGAVASKGVGAGLKASAKAKTAAGRTPNKLERLVVEPRPQVRISQGVARDQRRDETRRRAPSLIRAAGEKAIDRHRTKKFNKRDQRAAATGQNRRLPLRPEGNEVVYSSAIHRRIDQQQDAARQKAKAMYDHKRETAPALKAFDKTTKGLSKQEKRALSFVYEGVMPNDPAKAIPFIERRINDIGENRKASTRGEPTRFQKVGGDELPALQKLLKNPEKAFTPRVTAAAEKLRRIDSEASKDSPALPASRRIATKYGPQGYVLGMDKATRRIQNFDEAATRKSLERRGIDPNKALRGREASVEVNETPAQYARRVQAKAKQEGLQRPGYLPHVSKAGDVEPSTYATGGARAVQYKSRTLDNFKEGRVDRRPETIREGVAKTIKVKHNHRLVAETFDRHANKKYSGTNLSTALQKMDADGIDPGQVRVWFPGRFKDKVSGKDHSARGGDTEEVLRGLQDDARAAAIEPSAGKAGIEELRRIAKDPEYRDHKAVILDKDVYDEVMASTRPSGASGRTVDIINAKTARTILGTFNLPWLAVDAISASAANLLGGVMPLGPTWVKAQVWYKKLSPENKRLIDNEVGIQPRLDYVNQPKIGGAVENMPAGVRQMVDGWQAWRQTPIGKLRPIGKPIDLFMRAEGRFAVEPFRKAQAYKSLRDSARHRDRQLTQGVRRQNALMGELVDILKLGDSKRITKLLDSPELVEAAARNTDNLLGNWMVRTNAERKVLGRIGFFYPYLRYSLRMMFYTMPVEHPVVTSVLSKISQIGEDEVREMLGGEELPWGIGKIYYKKDGELHEYSLFRRANFLSNALTDADRSENLTGAVPPAIGMFLSQVLKENIYTGKKWTTDGNPDYGSANTDFYHRARILASQVLNMSFPIRVAGTTMASGAKVSSDSIPFSERPMRYKRQDKIDAGKKRVADHKSVSKPLKALQVAGLIPKKSLDDDYALAQKPKPKAKKKSAKKSRGGGFGGGFGGGSSGGFGTTKKPKTKTSAAPKKKSVVAKAGKPKLGTNEPDLRKLVRTEAVKNGLDPDLEEARIQQESGFQRRVTSSAGAQGVAQIMPGTAASWKVDPNDPVAAIKVSSKKMAEYTKAHGSYAKALVAYNAGPGRVGKPLYKETANYVANISQMAGKSADRRGGKAAASSSVRQVKNQIAKKTGLKVTSTFRDPKHNAAVGGVPNSYHTRGSKKNPKAADFVGTRKQMERGAAIARKAGLSALIHDAGSGVHLHIQDDGAAMGGGGGSSAPSGGGSYQMASGGRSASSRGQTIRRRGETASNYFDTAEGRMALLDFVRSKSKDRTKKLIFAMKAAQA